MVKCAFCKCLLAGCDVETTIKLCEISNKYPYPDVNALLRAINYQNYNALGAFDELTNRCKLEIAWKRFILDLSHELKIDRIVNWLESKLKKYKKGES